VKTVLILAALLGVQDTGALPKKRVLILGDSISMGYTPFVREALRDAAVVVRPALGGKDENCEGTAKGAKEIERWLALEGGKWDAIHFNFGLHDLKRVDAKTGKNSARPEDPRQSEPEAYGKNLREIVAALKKTGAKLVFACTTPVPAGCANPARDPEDPPRYNAIARKIAEENGIAVNDLHAFALPRLKEIQLPKNVHFTKEGSQVLAGEVVRHLREALGLK
jgi:acyl-CoA thioesterase-1